MFSATVGVMQVGYFDLKYDRPIGMGINLDYWSAILIKYAKMSEHRPK